MSDEGQNSLLYLSAQKALSRGQPSSQGSTKPWSRTFLV